MNKKEALLCTKIARATYGRDFNDADFTTTARFENKGTDTQGIFGVAYGKALLVAFRGSEETGITDWITDAKFIQTAFPYAKGKNFEVHQGFLEAYQSVRDAVLNGVNDSPHKRIICVGHSLGAGLATLCALDIQLNTSGKTAYCYTYGSPKVGDSQFAATYNQQVPHTFRFANGSDVVPLVPPGDYEHVGQLQQIGEVSELSFSFSAILENLTDKFTDHLPNSYVASVQAIQ